MADPASVEVTFAQVAENLGVLDILVNNAGQATTGIANFHRFLCAYRSNKNDVE